MIHLTLNRVGTPLNEPGVHVDDLGGLRGLDARREVFDPRARLMGRVKRQIGHLNGLLMVRDHFLHEHHVGFRPCSHLVG